MARIYLQDAVPRSRIAMGASSPAADVDAAEIEAILTLIGEDDAKSVQELADETDCSQREVQRILEELMDRGRITSTPDWRYRESRRSEA